MSENRDFLGEMEQLRAETDGIRNALVSHPALSNSSVLKSGILDEIARELKNIRSEIKEMKTENTTKLEELLQENQQLRQKIEENEEKMHEISAKLSTSLRHAGYLPIRDAIIGEWKMVKSENLEYAANAYGLSIALLSGNVTYKLHRGKLKETRGDNLFLIERETELYVEDDHLKTFWHGNRTIDRYIQDGKLHSRDRKVWKRIYQKI